MERTWKLRRCTKSRQRQKHESEANVAQTSQDDIASTVTSWLENILLRRTQLPILNNLPNDMTRLFICHDFRSQKPKVPSNDILRIIKSTMKWYISYHKVLWSDIFRTTKYYEVIYFVPWSTIKWYTSCHTVLWSDLFRTMKYDEVICFVR